MTEPPPLSDAPVFLLGSHKSGTSLLRALLDGHPELTVLPRETHFFPNSGHAVMYGLKRQPPTDDADVIRRRFADHVAARARGAAAKPGDAFSDAPDFAGYDAERFEREFAYQSSEPTRRQFERYAHALHAAATGEPLSEGARIVEKSVENAEFADLLAAMFPAARFVHIVRNPYATLVAIRRSRVRAGGRFPELASIVDAIASSFVFLDRNVRRLGEAHLVIRYEDLLAQPEASMRRVAEHLRIAFTPTLLQPTSKGAAWAGNSTSGDGFAGISAAPLSGWQSDLLPFEVQVVAARLDWVLDRFGYERVPPTRGRLRGGLLRVLGLDGAPRESVGTFLRNRALQHQDWPGAK